jgi:tRNA(Arg) A34 adenosine deaminase TadA
VPVGAVVVRGGEVIARAGNRMRELTDPTAHAEMLAIRAACGALGTERLTGCDLWVTLEPCPACAGAIAAARLSRLYYGAPDPKSGGVAHGARVFDHPAGPFHAGGLWRDRRRRRRPAAGFLQRTGGGSARPRAPGTREPLGRAHGGAAPTPPEFFARMKGREGVC